MMVLPPSDAVISSSNGYTYQELREYQIKQLNSNSNNNNLPVACTDNMSILTTADDGNCASDEIYCWMSCQKPITYGLSCNETAICVDPTTGVEHDGADMCTDW